MDRQSNQNFGKLIKPFGNMTFPISFQTFFAVIPAGLTPALDPTYLSQYLRTADDASIRS